MTVYKYLGRDAKGRKVSGSLKTDGIAEVISYLQTREITPLQIEKGVSYFKSLKNITDLLFPPKIPLIELLNFCREMVALSGAGVPLIDAFRQLAQTAHTHTVKEILSAIVDDLIAGKTLAASIKNYSQTFSPIFISIIEVGETTGNLNEAFEQLGAYLESTINNRRRLKTVTRYPIIVIVAVLSAIIVMNSFVIPKFAQIFSKFKAALPWPTRVLVAISNFMTTHWLMLVILGLGIIIGIPYLLKAPKVRYFWDKNKLRIPIFGELLQRIILAQFTWTLSLILKSGVSLIKGLVYSANTTGNAFFQRKILAIRDALEKGENFTTAAANSKMFPPAMLQMIAVGEESGRLEDIIRAISGYYEREIEYDIKRLNDALEPVLLTIIGIMVLILALGIYLPLWDLIRFVKVGAGAAGH